MVFTAQRTIKSILLGSALLASAVFAADKVAIETAKGEHLVATNPQKVAVLDLGVLDNLYALGVEVEAIQEKLFLPYLEEQAPDKQIPISTTHEPDIEALIKYQPDLIIIAQRTAKHYEPLARIAPTIDMTTPAGDLINTSKQRIRDYGKIFAKEAEAQALVAQLEKDIETARAAVAGKGKGLFVSVSGPKLAAYGKGSRFGWLHSELGIEEAVEGINPENRHGEAISFEFIKDANPQWLLVFDRHAAIGRDGPAAAEVLDNVLVKETDAWKKGQVIYFDGAQYMAVGGVQALESVVKQVTEAFNQAQ